MSSFLIEDKKMLRIVLIGVLSFLVFSFASALPNLSPVYQQSISSSGNNAIQSVVQESGSPNIILNNKNITNNDAINFSPVVNNNGDYAYAVTTLSNSQSTIILNGSPLQNTPGLNQFLAMNDNNL